MSTRRESLSMSGKIAVPLHMNQTAHGVAVVKGSSSKHSDHHSSSAGSTKNRSKKSGNNSNNNSPEKHQPTTITTATATNGNKSGVGLGASVKQGGNTNQAGGIGGNANQGSGVGGVSGASEDLIEIIKSIGYDDADLNLRFIALINILSNEENLCTRLLDRGTHFVLVAILSSLTGTAIAFGYTRCRSFLCHLTPHKLNNDSFPQILPSHV